MQCHKFSNHTPNHGYLLNGKEYFISKCIQIRCKIQKEIKTCLRVCVWEVGGDDPSPLPCFFHIRLVHPHCFYYYYFPPISLSSFFFQSIFFTTAALYIRATILQLSISLSDFIIHAFLFILKLSLQSLAGFLCCIFSSLHNFLSHGFR